MVEGVVASTASWWSVVERFAGWDGFAVGLGISLFLSWLLWDHVVGLGGWAGGVDIHGELVLGLMGVEVVDILMVVSTDVGVWSVVVSFVHGLVMEIVWGFPVVVRAMWVGIVLVFEWGSHLEVVMLNSVVDLSFHIVEQLIVGVLDIVDHLGTEVVVGIVVVIVTRVISVSSLIVSEILGNVMVIVGISFEELVVVLVVVWADKFWLHIMNPVVWMVLNTVGVVVLVDVLWVVGALVGIAVVETVVAINASVDVVVLTVSLTKEVTLVAEVWLVTLESPVTLIEMGTFVRVLTMDWSGVVGILMSVHLIWGQIVVWHVPSIMEWIVGSDVMLMEIVSVVVSWDNVAVVVTVLSGVVLWMVWLGVLLLARGSGRDVSDMVLGSWSVGEISHAFVWNVTVWHVSSVIPWVSVPWVIASVWRMISWVHSVAPLSTVWVTIWGWSDTPWSRLVLSVGEMVLLISHVRGGSWVSKLVVGISFMKSNVLVLVTWFNLTLGLVTESWLGLSWDNVSWAPDISMKVLVEIWLHLKDKITIKDV